jgi:hypothetical protein
MSFIGPAAQPSLVPRPQPQAPPRPPATADAVTPSVDRIARPQAAPSPGSADRRPADPAAAVPILVAAGALAGGAVLAAAPALAAAGEAGSAAAAVSARLSRAGAYVQTAAREGATHFRAAAEHVTRLDYRDPHAVGAALGEQAWTASEELARGAIVGAGVASGTWAAKTVAGAALAAFDTHRSHDRAR